MSPTILAFDTSAAHCAAALLSDDRIVAQVSEPMARGQAERLMPLLEEVLAEAGLVWRDLDALGVGVGPGNFTGIRIGVSAARGLALGLDRPAYGVDGFTARRLALGTDGSVAIPAPREQVWLSRPSEEPALIPASDAGPLPPAPDPSDLAAAIARRAAALWPDPAPAPAPLYLRPADAAPPREAPPVILDG